MKIGVISDTHIPTFAKDLPKKVREYFTTCDLIIHAGDSIERIALDKLGEIAETKAVFGNMDSADLKKSLPEKIIIEADGKKIGVFHGQGMGRKVLESAKGAFTEKMDIIIFGHSHVPVNEEEDGTLFFNPGSATDMVFSGRKSFGIIEIEDGMVKGEIINIED